MHKKTGRDMITVDTIQEDRNTRTHGYNTTVHRHPQSGTALLSIASEGDESCALPSCFWDPVPLFPLLLARLGLRQRAEGPREEAVHRVHAMIRPHPRSLLVYLCRAVRHDRVRPFQRHRDRADRLVASQSGGVVLPRRDAGELVVGLGGRPGDVRDVRAVAGHRTQRALAVDVVECSRR
ncbi:hypothetical protein OBBRIDRAFT_342625 [Obba rivulosa]|uniref:Uncharacterized protein n=1 Tax=Obba rivulosa TaxID=1052685 RepID=A0A8E2DGQ2_9APHY|nr:hypothetical protein OBBRIDRAFT_342625 [Obba rivulosa]